VDWSRYTPISGAGSVYRNNKTPYTMSANFVVERQLGSNMLLSVGYIGSLSRHLLAVHDVNPGNPALCLSLSQPEDVMPGTPTCGPFGENNVYARADGTIVNGTRSPYPNTIGTDAVYQNMGNANYNSLQASLKRTAGPLTFLASYTYGKSMDWASSIQEQVNPFNFRKEYAISAFDLKHNFVFSYNYGLPIEKLFAPRTASRRDGQFQPSPATPLDCRSLFRALGTMPWSKCRTMASTASASICQITIQPWVY
jgi:hypothetical protein